MRTPSYNIWRSTEFAEVSLKIHPVCICASDDRLRPRALVFADEKERVGIM